MFNKKSKIILGCLAFLLALSVGYALFSDTINVTGKISAKASFDISATCTKGINSELGDVSRYFDSDEHGYSNESCTVNGNTVTINANLNYPTARRFYTIKFTNNGTIPAMIHIDADTREGIINNSVVSVKNATGTLITNKLNQHGYNEYFREMTGVNLIGIQFAPETELFIGDVEESAQDDWGYTVLYPGGSLYAVISAIWDGSNEFNYADNGAYMDYNLSYQFNFAQLSGEVREYWEGLWNQQ